MREILFRRCRLEIEPSGIIRTITGDAVEQSTPLPDTSQGRSTAAYYGYDNLRKFHEDFCVAWAYILDLAIPLSPDDTEVHALMTDNPVPAFGPWDEMARFWFKRVRDGWPLVEHGQALNATTWTSFLASAIKADHDENNFNKGRDAQDDGQAISGGN